MLNTLITRRLLLKFLIYFYKGGKFYKYQINDINFDEDKPVLRTESQRFVFDKIVIACGALSKNLQMIYLKIFHSILREAIIFTSKTVNI